MVLAGRERWLQGTATSGGALTIKPGISDNPTSSAKNLCLCLLGVRRYKGSACHRIPWPWGLDMRARFSFPLYLELCDEFSHCSHSPAALSRER